MEAIGELTKVNQPVDRDEEMSAISYLVAKQQPSPAVLFERPRGFDKSPIGAKMLWNILGPSVKRVALTLEEPADTPTVELIRRTKDKLKRRLPPYEVSAAQAPIYQNTVTGKKIDLDLLPIPRHWPLDGGRYAGTGDAVITRDPDSGYLNIGTYRMMQQGKSQVGLYLSPGKDARLHITRAWQQGKPIHVAAAWGIDPLFMLVGSQTFPKNVSEYEYAGGIKGQPIPVVRGKTTDLLIPANAELVIEGVIRPNSVKSEGPFGEFPGYYGRPEAGCPLIDVTAVHYRTQPILTNALMADYPSCEQSGFFSVIRSAKIWDDLDKLGIPGIAGVYSHPAAAGGFGMTVISLEQRYAGHAAQVLALAAQVPGGAYYTKWIIAVDRGRRSDRYGPGDLGDGEPVQPDRRYRYPAQHLEHLARSDPEPAGKAALWFEGADQCLQRASPPSGLFQTHHAAQKNLRSGGRALDGTWLGRPGPARAGVRSRKQGHVSRGRRVRTRAPAGREKIDGQGEQQENQKEETVRPDSFRSIERKEYS